jgi:2-methylcitrate dehydratase PrpD
VDTKTQEPVHPTMAETLSHWLANLSLAQIPETVRHVATRDLIDSSGLAVASAPEVYCQQVASSWDATGPCTALGVNGGFDVAGAAVLNGLAIHGEDFDDTLEGAPIRVAAMTVPAAFAVGERYQLSGERVLLGVVAGLETVCRLNRVAPGAIHRAGFHPVGVIGALGACAAAGVTLGLNEKQLTNAFGLAGSFSSGLLEYLTDGAWTKRIHPGWAAQSGARAALIAKSGYFAPRTVLEGPKGFFKGFAHTAQQYNFDEMLRELGQAWFLQDIAFKPYACGTMIHPFIDCAIRMAESGIDHQDIDQIECDTGEGLVDRLWEPLAAKHNPPSGYAAKFSMPYCMAVAFFDRAAGLAQFTDTRVQDQQVRGLAKKIRYRIDAQNEYPRNYTGHMRVTLKNGQELVFRQPHFRGGAHEPLPDAEIDMKFFQNCAYGGWSQSRSEQLLQALNDLSRASQFDLSGFRG